MSTRWRIRAAAGRKSGTIVLKSPFVARPKGARASPAQRIRSAQPPKTARKPRPWPFHEAHRHRTLARSKDRHARVSGADRLHLQPPGVCAAQPRGLSGKIRETGGRCDPAGDEPWPLGHGPDRRALRRGPARPRVPGHRGASGSARQGASEAADRGLCLHAKRGQRPSGLGLGERPLRLTGCLQFAIFGGELLPAGVHGGIGAKPHARQASCRGTRTAL